jgi:uncharacterized protein YndB with AHSA1/START domain
MSTTFRIDASIAAPPSAVFAALTDPAALRAWLAEHADVALAEGRYAFWGRDVPKTRDGGSQRLLDAEDDRRLRFAWEQDGTDTEVEILLEPDGDGTALTLTQTESPDWDGDIAGVRDFWYRGVVGLTEHVEGRPPALRHDFSTSRSGEARVEIDIDAPIDRVFASLIEPEQVERWFGTTSTPDIEPRVGGRYDLGWDHGPIKILEIDPPRVLAYGWSNEGEADTVVRWELEGSEGGTHLTLVHSGFADGRPADGYQVGWTSLLVAIKRMHELGDAWTRISFAELTDAQTSR